MRCALRPRSVQVAHPSHRSVWHGPRGPAPGIRHATLSSLRPALTTAALLALLGLAGWALYATGYDDGYDDALLDMGSAGAVEEIDA